MDDKYIIGLTGNIATGKSLVLRMLKELGADTLDADDLVHILMRRVYSTTELWPSSAATSLTRILRLTEVGWATLCFVIPRP